jgi:ubiquitin C-terminal hydrolase
MDFDQAISSSFVIYYEQGYNCRGCGQHHLTRTSAGNKYSLLVKVPDFAPLVSYIKSALHTTNKIEDGKCSKCSSTEIEGFSTHVPNSNLVVQLNRLGVKGLDSRKLDLEASLLENFTLDGIKYSLKSFLIHTGSKKSGHYLSVSNSYGALYLVEDDKAKKVSQDAWREHLRNAYVLFYEGTPIPASRKRTTSTAKNC